MEKEGETKQNKDREQQNDDVSAPTTATTDGGMQTDGNATTGGRGSFVDV